MKLRRFIAGAATVSIFAGGIAHAGQYDAEVLGQSLPMWMETLASINDEGDVAWTAWDGTSGNQATTAKFYNAANPTHTLAGTANSSWAVGISEQVTDGGNTVVGIAGSTASSQRLTDRSAVLWDVRGPHSSVATSKLIDLGAVTNGTNGPVQQSAAYGVLARQGNANNYYVGGFARDKVNSQTFPQPVIWTVSDAGTANPSISHHTLPLIHPSATHGSGYVADIAQNGSKIWACGNSTGNNAYNQATCWDISGGPGSATVYNQLNTDLISSAGFSGNVVSSMIHRVRTVPIGPNGALRTVAVGAALVGSGGSHQWKGFVYDLDGTGGNRLYKDLNLTGENETLAYDVAALTYVGNNNGVQTTSHGMIIAGISSTASPAELGGLQGGPVGADTTKMTGVNRRMTLSGITDNGQVCAINDDSEFITSGYDQLLALSPEGDHRLAMNGNQLVLLTAMPDAATVNILNRTTSSRLSTRTPARTVQTYHQAQAQLAGSNKALAAILRFGNQLGCDTLDASGNFGSVCASSQSAFDINNAARLTLAAYPNTSVSSSTLNSAKISGSAFNASSYAYAQIALRDSDCTITPVMSAANIVVETRNASHAPTNADFDGELWNWCGAHNWVKTHNDVDNCSACGAQVQALTCADTTCNAGTPTLGAVDANKCAIGPNNQWECYNDGQRKPDSTKTYRLQTTYSSNTCGNASNVSRLDPCIRCDQSHSQTEWHEQKNTACCDANGNVLMDVYDRTVSANAGHLSCNESTMGIDKNNGFSRLAWWVDQRGLSNNSYDDWKQYTQESFWSKNGQCNLMPSATSEPQSLTKSDKGQPGYVRRIRASFTPTIDENDWYGFQVDDSPNDTHTPKPRVRVISHNTLPGHNRRARLKVCMYVDGMEKNQNYVSIKKVFFRGRGLGKFYSSENTSNPMMVALNNLTTPSGATSGGGLTKGDWLFDTNNPWGTEGVLASTNTPVYYYNYEFNPHNQSPAYDGRGGCFFTDDTGVIDLVYADYDIHDTNKEEAWVYVSVSLADEGVEELSCDQLKYTMYYGNDRSSTSSGKSGRLNDFVYQDSDHTYGCGVFGLGTCYHDLTWYHGCDDCCHESEWE